MEQYLFMYLGVFVVAMGAGVLIALLFTKSRNHSAGKKPGSATGSRSVSSGQSVSGVGSAAGRESVTGSGLKAQLYVTKDTTIGEILDMNPKAADVLSQQGMHCVGCPSSRGESLEQAGQVHGIDTDCLVDAVNLFFMQQES